MKHRQHRGPIIKRSRLLSLAIAGLLAAGAGAASAASGTVVHDTTASTIGSLGYQANKVAEFGQQVFPAETGPLETVTVVLSSWACEDGSWNTTCTSAAGATFDHPVTLSIYDDASGEVGAQRVSITETITVPFRPSTDAECEGGRWLSDDGCRNGLQFEVPFDVSGLGLEATESLWVTVAYDTQTWGYAPTGEPGPYDSLNVGVTDVDSEVVGTAGRVAFALGAEPQLQTYEASYDLMARLTITSEPQSIEDCKDGGFADFGFRNQGLCVAAVANADSDD